VVIPDFRSPPPPDIRVQVDGLRRAFPLYRFTIVATGRPADPLYIEVRRRDDSGRVAHWLLISSDARKIWRELRAGRPPQAT
ncbi:MAG TPA: hypothetical protein VKV33_01650, partial [Streptosporangiaceae bacterium]|nr:hypothetical protein [Streptosporangiaceae bacterium]